VFYRRKEGCYFAKAGVTHFAKDTFDSLFVSLVSLNLFLHVDKTSEGGVVNRVRDWVIRDCDRKEVGRIRGATQRSEVTLPVYRNDVLTFQEVVREVIERPMWFNANVELLSKHAPHVSVGGFRSRLSPSELYVPFAAALHLPPPPPPSQPLYPHARDLFFTVTVNVFISLPHDPSVELNTRRLTFPCRFLYPCRFPCSPSLSVISIDSMTTKSA
jgi:hypothetical protein